MLDQGHATLMKGIATIGSTLIASITNAATLSRKIDDYMTNEIYNLIAWVKHMQPAEIEILQTIVNKCAQMENNLASTQLFVQICWNPNSLVELKV